jgi:hypothetical protein
MCLLWCYNTLRRDGCKGICPDCACVSCVAVFVLAPVGFVGGLLYALLLGLAKWVPGAFHRVSTCCTCYCDVIQKGQEQYDIEDGRARPPPPAPSRGGWFNPSEYVERRSKAAGSKCAGEFYCCCLPAFWLLMVLYPVWILVELLLCGSAMGACEGMNAGCAGLVGWQARFRRAMLVIDRNTSQSAYGSPKPWFPAKDVAYAAPGASPPQPGYPVPGAPGYPTQAYPPQQPPVAQQPRAMPPQPPLPTAFAQPAPAQPVAYAQPAAPAPPTKGYPRVY